ncbi:MAG: lactate utilization protein [Armatimonadetes bacterium]|nr:lactate utilization protein [Armatimonadota bacterium]
MSSRVDTFARSMPTATAARVRRATRLVADKRMPTLSSVFADPEAARTAAADTKRYVLDNLHRLLLEFERNAIANGIQVHWALDAAEARETIVGICERSAPKWSIVAKAKSMATEEIHLNEALFKAGYPPVETDLGEFVIQLDHDTPSHIVAPIIHKDRFQVARSFERAHVGPYTQVPTELALQARHYLRKQFQASKIGVSGVNFAVASTGRIVIVENEGNNRLSTTAPDVHIAVMGIEKLLPTEDDLALFLPILAGSATGQQITTYVHMVTGPRQGAETDGPREVHLVLLDNGRTDAMASEQRDILKCIRCGACQNICPVYRAASGHGYGHVYGGPIGAVLAPSLDFAANRELPFASSLCGACEEVCPVKIPIPDMLVDLRTKSTAAGSWAMFATGATNPNLWRAGLALTPWLGGIGAKASGWAEFRDPPKGQGDFRRWWRERA